MRVIPDKPVIGVVGGGAIGTMLSAYLGAAGHRVVVSDVLEHVLEAIERDGVAVDGVGEARSRVAQTCRGVAAMAEHRPDLVFVCVKAPVLAVIGEDILEDRVIPHGHEIRKQRTNRTKFTRQLGATCAAAQ